MLTVGPQRLIVLSRARDPNGTANTAQLVWDLFNRLQWAVNAQIEAIVSTRVLNLNQRQCIYGLNQSFPNDALKVVGVRDGDRDLYPMEFEQLLGYNRRWPRAFADYLKYYALCGQDLLIVGPPLGELASTTTANVRFSQKTAQIAGDGDTFTIPDEDVASVRSLTEAILDAKARDWPAAFAALDQAAGEMGMEKAALRGDNVDEAP